MFNEMKHLFIIFGGLLPTIIAGATHYRNFALTPPATPQSKQELITLVKQAYKEQRSLTPYGSFGSYAELTGGAFAHQQYVNLHALNRILEIDLVRNTVRIEAGILLGDLIRELAKAGLQLVEHVASEGLSVVGALSTGAHGSSFLGYLPEEIEEIELIDGTGRLRIISSTSSPELLPAARVGLGCLGIIYSLTLRCHPLQLVRQDVACMHIDEFLKNLESYIASNISLHAELNPYSGLMRLHTISPTTQLPEHHNLWYASHQIGYPLIDQLMINIINAELSTKGFLRATSDAIDTLLINSNCISLIDFYPKVMTSFDYRMPRTRPLTLQKINEEEFAIPLAHLPLAIHAIRSMFTQLATQGIFNAHQLIIRFTRGTGQTLLGPVGKGIWAWINIVFVYTRLGYEKENTFTLFTEHDEHFTHITRTALAQLEDTLLPLDSRPHWGKSNYLTPEKIKMLYGNSIEQFIAIRRQLDPHNIFLKPNTQESFA